MWTTKVLTKEDLEAFKNKEVYVFEPHNFKGKICGKSYCVKCGLLSLNNVFTRWATEKGCNNENHPDYQRKRKLTSVL